MALTTIKRTETRPNFLESEVGLVLKTAQVDNANIEVDEYGYKTVKGGTPYPANDSTAKGLIFEDVDVTVGSDNGVRPASLMVAGRVLENRLHTPLSSAAKTALTALGFVFVDEPVIMREPIEPKEYTAGTTAFSGSDIAYGSGELTITAIDDSNTDSAVATVALSSSTHKVTATKVTAGNTTVDCTVSDGTNTAVITVPIELV